MNIVMLRAGYVIIVYEVPGSYTKRLTSFVSHGELAFVLGYERTATSCYVHVLFPDHALSGFIHESSCVHVDG